MVLSVDIVFVVATGVAVFGTMVGTMVLVVGTTELLLPVAVTVTPSYFNKEKRKRSKGGVGVRKTGGEMEG